MRIHLLRTDTTSLKVDALVHARASPAGSSEGGAVVSTGGNLLCRFVIQVEVAHASQGEAEAKLRAATLSAFERAEELAVSSVGLPSFGGRAFGFAIERSARIVIGAALEFRERARSLQRAVFCLPGQEEYAVFERVQRELGA